MTTQIARELIIIAGVNLSIYLIAAAYIDYKINSKTNRKKKGFLE
jgi:hypothetical protein